MATPSAPGSRGSGVVVPKATATPAAAAQASKRKPEETAAPASDGGKRSRSEQAEGRAAGVGAKRAREEGDPEPPARRAPPNRFSRPHSLMWVVYLTSCLPLLYFSVPIRAQEPAARGHDSRGAPARADTGSNPEPRNPEPRSNPESRNPEQRNSEPRNSSASEGRRPALMTLRRGAGPGRPGARMAGNGHSNPGAHAAVKEDPYPERWGDPSRQGDGGRDPGRAAPPRETHRLATQRSANEDEVARKRQRK